MQNQTRSYFYKHYFNHNGTMPPSEVYLFYKGRPLYHPATFELDKYKFKLPRNLEDKMVLGELEAAFEYIRKRSPGCPDPVSVVGSIVLSDRYD